MTENPYVTPAASSDGEQMAKDSPESLSQIARQTFLAWERLRVLYAILLAMLTVLLAGPDLLRLRTLGLIVEGAIVANLCYFAGPALETYVRWLGYHGKWFRWLLFVGGTCLTAMLAILTLVNELIPQS